MSEKIDDPYSDTGGGANVVPAVFATFIRPTPETDVRNVTSVNNRGAEVDEKFRDIPNNKYLGEPRVTTPPIDVIKNSAEFIVKNFLFNTKSDFYLNQQNLRLFNKMGGNIFNPLGITTALYFDNLDTAGNDTVDELTKQSRALGMKTLSTMTGMTALYTTDGETFGSFVDTIPGKFYDEITDLGNGGASNNVFKKFGKFLKNTAKEAVGENILGKKDATRSIVGQVMAFTSTRDMKDADKRMQTRDGTVVDGIGEDALSLIYGVSGDIKKISNSLTATFKKGGEDYTKKYPGFWALTQDGKEYQRDKIGYSKKDYMTAFSVKQYISNLSIKNIVYYNTEDSNIDEKTYINNIKNFKDNILPSIKKTINNQNYKLPDDKLYEPEFTHDYRLVIKTPNTFDVQPIEFAQLYGINRIKDHMIGINYSYRNTKTILNDSAIVYDGDRLPMTTAIGTSTIANTTKKHTFIVFKDLKTSRYIYLDANFDSIVDDMQPITEELRVPSPTPLRKITGFNRNINLSFKMYAKSPTEMEAMYKKINYLKYLTAPRSDTRYNLLQMTLGSLFNELTVFISSFSTTFDNTQTTWEIDEFIVPKVVDCSLSMTVFYNSINLTEDTYSTTFHKLPSTTSPQPSTTTPQTQSMVPTVSEL